MSISPNAPWIPLAALVVSTLLLGGAVGNQFAQWRQVKEQTKEIEQKYQEIVNKVAEANKLLIERDKKSLEQIDSVYNILGVLASQENQANTEIKKAKDKINRGKTDIDSDKKQLKEEAAQSDIFFKKIKPENKTD